MRLTTLIILIILIGGAAFIAYKKGYFQKAGEAVESSFSVHLAKGKSLYQRTEYEAAIQELEKAIAANPNHEDVPRAMRCMGDCYKELRQPEKAVAIYKEIIEKYPDDRMRGDVEKAIEKVEQLGYY